MKQRVLENLDSIGLRASRPALDPILRDLGRAVASVKKRGPDVLQVFYAKDKYGMRTLDWKLMDKITDEAFARQRRKRLEKG